jgi:hypothetical protein
VFLIAAGAVIIIAAAALYRLFIYTPAPSMGFVSLNVLPWAEVVKIENSAGGVVPLKDKPVTPCRLTLNEGTYTVYVANPAYAKPLVMTITVRNDEVQEVNKEMPGYDYRQGIPKF